MDLRNQYIVQSFENKENTSEQVACGDANEAVREDPSGDEQGSETNVNTNDMEVSNATSKTTEKSSSSSTYTEEKTNAWDGKELEEMERQLDDIWGLDGK